MVHLALDLCKGSVLVVFVDTRITRVTTYFTFNRTLYTTTMSSVTTTALDETSEEVEQSTQETTTTNTEPLFTNAAAVATTLAQTIVKVHFLRKSYWNAFRPNKTLVYRPQWASRQLTSSNVTVRPLARLQ